MYRIVLADDEGIVINSLIYILEKNFEGQFEIETVKSGRAAIEMAEHFRPDIMFMDIQMPGINGIDAMHEIKKSVPGVLFIILTAYDKFDYAKEAINLGVLDYLNKPFNQKAIVEVIERAKHEIDLKREKRKTDLRIKERLETVVPFIENGFIYSLLLREHFEEDIENYRNLLGIETKEGIMLVLVFGEMQSGSHMTNAVGTGVKTQLTYYTKVREAIKASFPEAIVGAVSANKIPVFLPNDKCIVSYDERVHIIDSCRELVDSLEKLTDIHFRIGIGSSKNQKEAVASYEEAIKALYSTEGHVAHVDDLPIQVEYEKDYPVDIENKLFAVLEDGKVEETVMYASVFFDWMVSQYSQDEMSIKLKVLEFVIRAEASMYRSGGHVYKFADRTEYLPEVFYMKGLDSLKNWFVDKIQDAAYNLSTGQADHTNHMIQKAKEYIDGHFNKDLSLDDISRELNISPYYFSKLFKEETGENFVEYLNMRRIEAAMEMLKNPEISIKEIGTDCGYSDPNYFSRIFKKYQGVTPTEYRETHRDM